MSELVHCKYCNEMMMIDCPEETTAKEKERMIIEYCNCDKAQVEKERLQEIVRAKERIDELFGESSIEMGFEPIDSQRLHNLMNEVVELASSKIIRSVTINVTNRTTAKISISKGKIDVERTQVTKYKL